MLASALGVLASALGVTLAAGDVPAVDGTAAGRGVSVGVLAGAAAATALETTGGEATPGEVATWDSASSVVAAGVGGAAGDPIMLSVLFLLIIAQKAFMPSDVTG